LPPFLNEISGENYFSVWTSDPNAPAINLTAEIDENPL